MHDRSLMPFVHKCICMLYYTPGRSSKRDEGGIMEPGQFPSRDDCATIVSQLAMQTSCSTPEIKIITALRLNVLRASPVAGPRDRQRTFLKHYSASAQPQTFHPMAYTRRLQEESPLHATEDPRLHSHKIAKPPLL